MLAVPGFILGRLSSSTELERAQLRRELSTIWQLLVGTLLAKEQTKRPMAMPQSFALASLTFDHEVAYVIAAVSKLSARTPVVPRPRYTQLALLIRHWACASATETHMKH